MIPFEEIDDRLASLKLDRAWLVRESGRSPGSIRSALAPNASPKHRSDLLQKALSDVIEQEELRQRKGAELPDRVTLEVTPAEFEAFNLASLAEDQTLKQWCLTVLNKAATRAAVTAAGENTVAFPAAKDESAAALGFELEALGGIAAGTPIDSDAPHGLIRTSKQYPSDHYALLVFGKSMEPKIPDQSYIVVKQLPDGWKPKKGDIVVYNDAHGATLKVLAYRKAKGDEEGDNFGNVPMLKSMNPDFPDVQTLEDGKISAVFVELLPPP